MRRKWILLAIFVVHIEGTILPKCVMLGEQVGGAECVGDGYKKSVDGVSPRRPQSFRYRPRPVDDCSPGQGQPNKGGTVDGGMDHCRESQRVGLQHAVVCLNVTRRTKERVAQSKRARDGSLAIVD